MDQIEIKPGVVIPVEEFEFSYARSSGPGGQNVNKLNTKVTLRWDIESSSSLPEGIRRRARRRYANRISKEGHFLIHSQRFRERERNVSDCLEKLQALLVAIADPPKPRKKTRPTKASKRRRLAEKKQNAAKKQSRQSPRLDE